MFQKPVHDADDADVRGGFGRERGRIQRADATDDEIKAWCEKNNEPFEDAMRLNKRVLWGEKHYYIEPVVHPKGKLGPFAGGNYATTSNATWSDILGERTSRPLPIHDRFETQEEYDLLSS